MCSVATEPLFRFFMGHVKLSRRPYSALTLGDFVAAQIAF